MLAGGRLIALGNGRIDHGPREARRLQTDGYRSSAWRQNLDGAGACERPDYTAATSAGTWWPWTFVAPDPSHFSNVPDGFIILGSPFFP